MIIKACGIDIDKIDKGDISTKFFGAFGVNPLCWMILASSHSQLSPTR